MDSQEPKESNDVRFIALRCIVLQLSTCENSAEFPAVIKLFTKSVSLDFIIIHVANTRPHQSKAICTDSVVLELCKFTELRKCI